MSAQRDIEDIEKCWMRNKNKIFVKLVSAGMLICDQYLLYFKILIVSIQSINHD